MSEKDRQDKAVLGYVASDELAKQHVYSKQNSSILEDTVNGVATVVSDIASGTAEAISIVGEALGNTLGS